jgi:hypothetical protein
MSNERTNDPYATRSELMRRRWWLLLAAAGIVCRFVVAYVSKGTQDTVKWNQFAELITQHGMRFMYENVADYNHPPLTGWMASYALAFSRVTALPFHFIFKVPAILADILATVLLWSIWSQRSARLGQRAAALFSWSLASILVSAFHGNTDCIAAFLCLLAGYLCDARKKDFLSGLALGAAINVKLIPVFCIPGLLVSCQSWRRSALCALGLACGVLPFLPFLVTSGGSFYRNAIAYNSNFDNWGTGFLLNSSALNPRLAEAVRALADWWKANARYAILAGVVLLAATARLKNAATATVLIAASLAIFLFLTPGFGVQYTVYVIPSLFAVSLSVGWAYATLAGIFIGLVYWTFMRPGFPFYSNFDTVFPMPAPLVGLFAWVLLGQWIVRSVREFRPLRGMPRES